MPIFQDFRNARLREMVGCPNLEKFRQQLDSGANPLQPVLDPNGEKGQMTTLLHAMLAWPADGLAYTRQDCRRAPLDSIGLPKVLSVGTTQDMEDDHSPVIPAKIYEPFVRIALSRGIDPEEKDQQGVSLRELAEKLERTNWLPFRNSAPQPLSCRG